MTNLAYNQSTVAEQSNVSYIDFAAHAARRAAQRKKKALCMQHRYGAILTALCLLCTVISLATTFTDLTALLVLAPLGLYLLLSKNVILYRP